MLRKCPVCGELYSRNDAVLITDRYGIPYKYVCGEFMCVKVAEQEIARFVHDPGYAGEELEPEEEVKC